MKSRIFLGATLFVLLVVIGGAVGAQRESQRPFTLAQHATQYDANGHATPLFTAVRRGNERGGWVEVQQYTDGHTRVMRSEPGRGVYSQHGEKAVRLGEAQAGMHTEAGLRSSPNYQRDDTMLGNVRVAVESVKSGGTEIELWLAYDFVGVVVLMVKREADGYFVLEPDALTD